MNNEHPSPQPPKPPAPQPAVRRARLSGGRLSGARGRRTWVFVALILAAVGLSLPIGFLAGRSGVPDVAEAVAEEAAATIWTCSMDPQVKMPEPGLCPVCGMDLIPLDNEPSGPRELKMSKEAMRLAEIQVEPVVRKYVPKVVRMVGKVADDETRTAEIAAWVPGRLDHLYVDYTGIRVRQGDRMAYMYSPDLIVAQRELLQTWQAYQRANTGRSQELLDATLKSAEEKLRLLGLPDQQIKEIKARSTPSDHLTIFAPIGGTVTQRHVNEGEYVQTGTKIYTIVDLSHVWVYLDAYESDIPWLRYGQKVEFTTETYPGRTFPGTIVFIDPVLNEKTRISRVRVNVPNEDEELKPGMFVHAKVESRLATGGRVLDPSLAGKWISPHHPEIVKDGPGKCDLCGMDLVPVEEFGIVGQQQASRPPLVVPATAPLITGKRAVVYVRVPTSENLHRQLAAVWKAAEHPADAASPTSAGLAEKIETAWRNAGRLKRWRDAVEIPPPPQENGEKKEWNFDLLFGVIDNLHQQAVEKSKGEQPTVEQLVEAIRAAWKQAGELSDWERPSFEGREITLGHRVGDYYLVRGGLEEGEQVATSGAFKIDSELQIRAMPSMMGSQALDVPDEFRRQLTLVYTPYFQLRQALADDEGGDRLQEALEAFGAMKKAVLAVSTGILERRIGQASQEPDPRVGQQWQSIRMRLIRNLTGEGRPSTIKQLRKRFLPLSMTLIEMVDTFGHAEKETLYEAHCPMALGNEGASWLQAGKKRANPYFARNLMLGCIEIKRYWRTTGDPQSKENSRWTKTSGPAAPSVE